MKENNQIFVETMGAVNNTAPVTRKSAGKWQAFGLLVLFMLMLSTTAKTFAYNNNPSGVSMTRTGTSATITWTSCGAPHYYWSVTTSPTFGPNTIVWPPQNSLKNGSVDGTSVTVTGLPATGTLYAWVAGVDNTWLWTPPPGYPTPPPPPACTNASTPSSASGSAGTTTASLSWGASSGSATIYYYWSCSDGSSGNTTGTSASVSSLSPGTAYSFSVYAQSNSACNTASGSATGYFTTTKYSQTISFSLPTKTYGDGAFIPNGSAPGGTVSYTSSNNAVAYVSGGYIYTAGAGSCTITASQGGNSSYYAAPNNAQTLYVNKASQTISFGALGGKTYGDVPYSISASGGGSGNAVTFSSSNTAVATVSGTTVTIKAAGGCYIYANQATSANYSAAAQVSQYLTVSKAAALTITPDAKSKVYGAGEPTLTYTPSGTLRNGDSYAAAMSGVTMSTNTGAAAIVAGPNVISVTGSYSANYNLSYATGTLTVSKAAALTVTADNKSKVYGLADPTLTYTLTGTLYYGNTASVVSGVGLSANTGALATFGTHTITASGGVAANYNVTHATGTLTVSKAPQTIINAVAANKKYDDNTDAAISGAAVNLHYYSDDMQLATATAGVFASKAVANHVHVTTSMTLTGTAAFNYNLTQPDYLYANITPGDIDYFTVAGITTSVIAGVTTSPVVTAYDHWANLKTDYTGTIVFSSDDVYPAVLPSDYTFIAGDNGTHTFVNGVTLKTTGTRTVTVTSIHIDGEDVFNYAGKTGSQTSITVIPAALDHYTLTTQRSGSETAGVPFTVTATAYDMYDNIKTNYGGADDIVNFTGPSSVNWTTTSNSSSNGTARIIAVNGNQTFTNGISAGITGFTLFNSDQSLLTPFVSPTITITDAGTSKTGTTTPIMVHHVTLNNFEVVAGTNQTSGIPFSSTVTARDIYWNTATTYVGHINFKSSDDAHVTFPAPLQPYVLADAGVRTFTNQININPTGVYWLRAADAIFAFKSGEQQNILVGPGAFASASDKSVVTVDNLNKIAGQEVKVTLTPKDAQGNLLYSCQNITVLLDGAVKSGTHQETQGTIDGADGVYTFYVPVTSTTANNIISAKLGEVAFGQTFDISVTPAPPTAANTLITSTGGMTTDETKLVTVQLYDKYNNLRTTDDGDLLLATDLGLFGGYAGSKTVSAVYGASGSGSYTATLYASTDGLQGTGTATITGHLDPNSTAGPGDYVAGVSPYAYVAAPWPAHFDVTDNTTVVISEGLPNLTTSVITATPTTMTTDEHSHILLQLKDHLGNLIRSNRGTATLNTSFAGFTNVNGSNTVTAAYDGTTTGSSELLTYRNPYVAIL